MKIIPIYFLVVLFFAFSHAGRTGDPKTTIPDAAKSTGNIGCAPPDSRLAIDFNGKFIPALPGLGHHRYTISTQQDSTQFFFNQGINFYYSYHLREALASFKEAARFDSSSAMTYWGQALSMGPYFNAYYYKMRPGVLVALNAMNRHRSGATEKEKALMDAMQQRYSTDTTYADRSRLDRAYASALSGLTRQYPNDDDIKTLYIDAVMLEHKWDFWTTDGTPKQWTGELVALCEGILKRDPHQPAALHYYIHLTEASGQPGLALAGADVLKNDMPGVGHMVHMATHMYQRNGLFVKGVMVNEEANTIANTEDSLAPMLGLGRNNIIHIYAVQSFCAMSAGMYKKGMPIYLRARERLLAGNPPFEKDIYSQSVYMMPEVAWVRLGRWDEILQAAAPDLRWKYARILYHFAKGMANLHRDDLQAAKADLDSLRGNLQDSLLNIRIMPYNKPTECGIVAAGILEGEILFKEGKQDKAIAVLDQTVAEEDALIYREPQQWFIPARHYLGACLLKMKKFGEAEKVYRQDLNKNPGNGWSLLGLYQSLAAKHRTAEAARTKTRYLKAFEACDVHPFASAF